MSLNFAPEVGIGRDASWILAFHQIIRDGIEDLPVAEISRDDYYGDIAASLPAGLEGGSYRFVIEGITDSDYAQIDQTQDDAPSVVKLYLYYRDLAAPDFGIGTNLLGSDFINAGARNLKSVKHRADLVATLRIVSVQRRVGSRNYEAVIEARELVFDLVQSRRSCGDPIDLTDAKAAVTQLMQRAWPFPKGSVPFEYHEPVARISPPPEAPPANNDAGQVDSRQPILAALQSIGARLERQNNRFGRGMLLIRNGKLHVGERPIPLDSSGPKALTLSQGLLEPVPIGTVETDPNWDLCQQQYKPPPRPRNQYRITLRGRGDLKPGDLVVFDAPGDSTGVKPPLGGAFGALGDLGASVKDTVTSLFGDNKMKNPVQLYVNSVEHRLSRNSGFITSITGVQLGTDRPLTSDEIWDAHSPLTDPVEPPIRPARATAEERAADAVVGVVRRESGRLSGTDIGEIRAFRPAGQDPQPGQTSSVFRGTAPLAVRHESRRAEIKRPSDAPADSVPYLTPFAWGRCGLVLPRYPGMRIALTHNHHQTGEPIDMGAIWKTDHAPTEAQAGDWWLSLPAESPDGNAPPDGQSGDPTDYTGRVTDDLTDSAGNRVIQAGALVVRFGQTSLQQAGARPTNPPAPNSVTIEHPASGARIQMKEDGSIEIAGGIIRLKASDQVSIDAPKVVVTCQSMQIE
jgi:hypothetical protein